MLAKSIFLADPSQIQAGQQAALLLVQNDPQQALWFARELPQTFPDDPAVGQLAQDMLIAQGERRVAFKLYEPLVKAAPNSVGRALLAARAAPPEQAREAYARVLERFPESPEAMRAVSRLHLVDDQPREALNLLKEALSKGPESLEDLELRVRTLVSAREVREASVAVKQFRGDPRHASWELAVLGGRLARIAGPSRTQYVTRDLLPPALARSPEHTVAFALLTGDSSVSDAELNAVADPVAREALAITRALFKDFEEAVEQAARVRAPVLSRLDLETAALLALEFSRRGEKEAAQRVFGSSLALLAARAPLLDYVNMRVVRPEFPLLPPGLRAAAYLIRARASPEDRSEELDRARQADVLGGMARRALDGHEEETVLREEGVHSHTLWESRRRSVIHHTIRGSGPPPPAASPPTREGDHHR
jgi:tetratricopeptide (TPR) repeat protein